MIKLQTIEITDFKQRKHKRKRLQARCEAETIQKALNAVKAKEMAIEKVSNLKKTATKVTLGHTR
ncbi:hypothetical protein [Dolosigranulum pigrum]|uniref:Uncharacterized protein n=1 Tax=Dolosigranulum pigrum TaxID=29394 RepID=A0A516GHM6_9LACT|nr:hypothetical protein [Dolosigranulum pigrum]QDO91034.1 hypothetical protein FNV33_02835 [Dolosigranulum pigrum]